MKTLNFKRIISIVAFVALAGFSCLSSTYKCNFLGADNKQ